MNILAQIAENTRELVAERRRRTPLTQLRAQAEAAPAHKLGDFAFEKALRGPDVAFICEVKKASPSKGVIAEDFPYLQIAQEYEAAGAEAISVLTEPRWFLGAPEYLAEISREVSIPTLRKDFIIDEYMIYEAKLLGAAAVLLICELLSTEQAREYRELAESLGMSALVEAYDDAAVQRAAASGAKIIGVNNRDLTSFEVDFSNAQRLRAYVPEGTIFVAESGVKTPADVEAVRAAQADAILIGETLMRADNKTAALAELRGH
ncbi:indole-3-glycerol phosphate synthase [Actinobaculum suis]|uniref:Indole-3-glycerol phosphate synthase n=1 Tax=Actinobaculum suis TaxID=1657 RepID=A0A0K9EUS9_9ACTO|nr:indole-3-glycerol phosphate synthase TrpC [Actinobaculum suis]KMY23949.1 indole-3-glycerol phosphate synthase [Actinobaculum suis]MDY5153401.1 indole-3-glycerol phosphate synthase TrpC [Actinobaculum suis]OCA93373.1 indole-3-glycerol phosphate synthase [Actinobaculum suis]OCA94294.1 indole-3-glycerol phosphate synthase [Actinobaculum suis]SDE17070.1 indole-3-glycerol phosphate synthase [Actinobaculum suis]